MTLASIFIINPFWPIWGEYYNISYNQNDYIKATPSSLDSFLKNNHYSFFQHFSSIFGLICLYLAVLFLALIFVLSFIQRRKYIFIDILASSLLAVSSIILPFTCNYSVFPFTAYSFLPLAASFLIVFELLYNFKKASKSTM